MRKRPLASKVDDHSMNSEDDRTHAQVCATACQSLVDSLTAVDQQITARLAVCSSKESPLGHLRPLMKIMEISCHGVPWLLGSLLMFLLAHRASDVVIAVNLFAALIVDMVVVAILKMIFRRSRPSHNVMDMFAAPSVDKFSFPSGHSTRAAMMGWFLCEHYFPSSQALCLLVGLWSVAVASSRVLLGRHHISDVVIGFVIGLACYHLYVQRLWVSQSTCMTYLDTYFGHVHL